MSVVAVVLLASIPFVAWAEDALPDATILPDPTESFEGGQSGSITLAKMNTDEVYQIEIRD